MPKKNDKNSMQEFVIQYLKKNKNFILNFPELLNVLNLPYQIDKTGKVIDLNAYRSIKIKKDYEQLKKQMSEILKAGNSHIVSQKRILKTSLKVLNTKSLNKLIDVLVNDFGPLLGCDLVNCFFTGNKIKHRGIRSMDNKIATSFFRDKPQTYLNQNPKGIPIFFLTKSKIKMRLNLKLRTKRYR